LLPSIFFRKSMIENQKFFVTLQSQKRIYKFLLLHWKRNIVQFLLSYTSRDRDLEQEFCELVYIVNITIYYFLIMKKVLKR
jgi:hypothetical protein